jgi:hypothetical protein
VSRVTGKLSSTESLEGYLLGIIGIDRLTCVYGVAGRLPTRVCGARDVSRARDEDARLISWSLVALLNRNGVLTNESGWSSDQVCLTTRLSR